jgi:ABC-2 type transport system permease protein
MIAALVRAEVRKVASTRLWWVLLVPAAVLSVLVGVFSGVFTLALGAAPDAGAALPLTIASLAYALAVAAVAAALHGAVATAGEFRHRTVTTTYLAAPGRGPVLLAQMLTCAGVGAGYGVAVAALGVAAGLLARGGARMPGPGALLLVVAIGAVVCALWGALGAALGVLAAHQAGVAVGLLGWVLVAEPLLSVLLAAHGTLAPLTAWLPANAGETALYTVPAAVLGDPGLVGPAAGVTGPLPWPAAVAVLAGWTALAAAAATARARTRDVT